MKIQSVQRFNSIKDTSVNVNYSSTPQMANQLNSKDSYTPSFGVYGAQLAARAGSAEARVAKLFSTLEGRRELAEYFHKRPQDEIILLCEVRRPSWLEAPLKTFTHGGVLDVPATKKKYNEFKGLIDDVIRKKSTASLPERQRLDAKADKCSEEFDLRALFHTVWGPEYKP